jgi:hypothetical protein
MGKKLLLFVRKNNHPDIEWQLYVLPVEPPANVSFCSRAKCVLVSSTTKVKAYSTDVLLELYLARENQTKLY